MAHSVTITGPVPSLEEFGKSLGLSKKEQRDLLAIVDRATKPRIAVRRKAAASTEKAKSGPPKPAK